MLVQDELMKKMNAAHFKQTSSLLAIKYIWCFKRKIEYHMVKIHWYYIVGHTNFFSCLISDSDLACYKLFSFSSLLYFAVNFDHFQILRAIGKGSFGKVRINLFLTVKNLIGNTFVFFWLD